MGTSDLGAPRDTGTSDLGAPRDNDELSPEGPASEDRRARLRHQAYFPAQIDAGQGQRSALIRDLSVTGALLLTRARLKVGDPVKLSLYISGDPENVRVVAGRVVRDERRSVECSDVWPHSAAIHFDEALTAEFEPEVKRLAEYQASLGAGSKKG
jgi:hypothetical protein